VGTDSVSAATGSTTPNPNTGSRPAGPWSSAVASNRLTTSAAGNSGHRARTSAAVAATSAEEKLVPCTARYPPPASAPVTTEGAASTVSGPVSDAGQPAGPLPDHTRPATATTPGSRAGYHTWMSSSSSMLPVQATTTTSLAMAISSASCSDALWPSPPRDRLITWAPSRTAHTTPSATVVALWYRFWLSSTRTGKMVASGARPTATSAPRPAISEATVVP